MADPNLPPIPQPVADIGALATVAQALKQRVEALTAYALGLKGGTAVSSSGSSAQIPYTLPIASVTTLGGIKVDGESTTVVNGVLHVTGGQPAINPPVMDGVSTVGRSLRYAREDHVHPVDETRYSVANPRNYATVEYVDSQLNAPAMLARQWFNT
jgi:hypothetical protein